MVNNGKHGITPSEWRTFQGIFSACVTNKNSRGHYTQLQQTAMLLCAWRYIVRKCLIWQWMTTGKFSCLKQRGPNPNLTAMNGSSARKFLCKSQWLQKEQDPAPCDITDVPSHWCAWQARERNTSDLWTPLEPSLFLSPWTKPRWAAPWWHAVAWLSFNETQVAQEPLRKEEPNNSNRKSNPIHSRKYVNLW